MIKFRSICITLIAIIFSFSALTAKAEYLFPYPDFGASEQPATLEGAFLLSSTPMTIISFDYVPLNSASTYIKYRIFDSTGALVSYVNRSRVVSDKYFLFDSTLSIYGQGYTIEFSVGPYEDTKPSYDTAYYACDSYGNRMFQVGFGEKYRIPFDSYEVFRNYLDQYWTNTYFYIYAEKDAKPVPTPTLPPEPDESYNPGVTPTPTPNGSDDSTGGNTGGNYYYPTPAPYESYRPSNDDLSDPPDLSSFDDIVQGFSRIMGEIWSFFPLFGIIFIMLLVVLYIKVVL